MIHRGEHELHKREVEIKAKWLMPITLAAIAAVVAAFGNVVVTLLTGSTQRDLEIGKAVEARLLEEHKAEAARILEVIKPGNTGGKDQAVTYLQFFLDTGLISHPGRREEIQQYLDRLKARQGPALPADSPPASLEVLISNLRQQVRENPTATQREREALGNLLLALEALLSEFKQRSDRH
jgi:hypothetical protein